MTDEKRNAIAAGRRMMESGWITEGERNAIDTLIRAVEADDKEIERLKDEVQRLVVQLDSAYCETCAEKNGIFNHLGGTDERIS